MRVLLYEHCTSGGLLGEPAEKLYALATEGRAMLSALAADLAQLDGVEPVVLRDHRLTDWNTPGCLVCDVTIENIRDDFARLASAQWTILIAPEFDSILLRLIRFVQRAGGRPLVSSTRDVWTATDKQGTAEHLSQHGVPVPTGCRAHEYRAWVAEHPGPYVVKPADGAGSQRLRKVPRITSRLLVGLEEDCELFRIEQFAPGLPASVAFLCGPAGNLALPPCAQRLENDGSFAYSGGQTPLEPALARRATQLAARAIETLEAPLGWIGVDLVLDDDPSGAGDRVIEINPRLTTSYVGLRAACRENLAGAILAVAEGRSVSLSFRDERVEFDADGTVRILQPDGIPA